MAKLFFFDVCDTLYNENTTFGFLEYYFSNGIKSSLLNIRKIYIIKIFNYLSVKLFSYDFIRYIGIFMLKNESKKDLKFKAKQYVANILKHKKNMEVHTLLSRYKEEKREIVLLSGSLDFIIEEIAKSLGIPLYYATTLQQRKGIILGSIDVDLLGNKRSVIDKYYARIPYVLVTDNLSDFSIAKNAEKSYILTKEKHKNLWETIDNVTILKTIP